MASRPHRAVTIVDVAESIGVSPSTVSRVLRGDERISAATAERVRNAAAALGYHPNMSAQELVQGRSHAIGVLIRHFMSPYFAEILTGIEEALVGSGYHLIVASSHALEGEEAPALELLVRRRVDGLIAIQPSLPDEELVRAVPADVPVVCVGRLTPGNPAASVVIDNRAAARELVEFLLSLGHRHIAHITGDPSHLDARARLAGYHDALRDAGIATDARLVAGGTFLADAGYSGVETLVQAGARFTALFVANDVMAPSALLALARLGFAVPRDVSVVGFDDDQQAQWLNPPLTTIRQQLTVVGASAGATMLRVLRGEEPAPEHVLPQLLVRDSTAPPPRRSAG
jgi:LacI family transcriptional regulator